MRVLLSEVLSADFDVDTAHDGIDAMEKLLTAEPYDAMVLDLTMPRMGGVDVLTRIRAMAAFVDLPVLVLSGHYESLGRIAAIEAGASDFMTKPFNPIELKLRLSRLLPVERKSVKQSGFAQVVKMMRRPSTYASA